jgi:hypothetical protein
MQFLDLPSVLHCHILTFLDLPSLFYSVRYLNKYFLSLVDPSSSAIKELKEIHLNIPEEITQDVDIFTTLMKLAFQTEKILNFVGYFTDGGVFMGATRFYVHHMFHYSGAVYTADNLARNVLTAAYYDPDLQPLPFDSVINEDLNAYFRENTYWYIPPEYLNNHVIHDRFMKNSPPRSINSFTPRDYSNERLDNVPVSLRTVRNIVSGNRTYIQTLSDKEFYKLGLASRIGIGRPAFGSCPVKTLCVSTHYMQSPIDISEFEQATSLEALMNIPDLPKVIQRIINDDFIFVEFEGRYGPLCWVHFINPAYTQLEVVLQRPRLLMHVEVLLINIDDRRREFQQTDLGMDISYVVFGGYDDTIRLPTPMRMYNYLGV